jgi:hypothetical protein
MKLTIFHLLGIEYETILKIQSGIYILINLFEIHLKKISLLLKNKLYPETKKNKELPIVPPVAKTSYPLGYNTPKCEFVINIVAMNFKSIIPFILCVFFLHIHNWVNDFPTNFPNTTEQILLAHV